MTAFDEAMDATSTADSQTFLDGMAEAPASGPELDACCSVAAAGRALEPALARISGHDDVQVVVLIEQRVPHHPQALPLLAVWHFPAEVDLTERYERAQAWAADMPKGADVVAHGQGLELGTWHKQPVLRLLRCDGVTLTARIPHPAGSAHQGAN